MLTNYEFERKIQTSNEKELIIFLMEINLLNRSYNCPTCNTVMNLVSSSRNKDKYAWRCMQRNCRSYKTYISIRRGTFFEPFKLHLSLVLLIIVKYCSGQQLFSIITSLDLDDLSVSKIINHLISKIPNTDFRYNKLGGPGTIIQIDETMLNFKCKSHRGRSPLNRTDSLCIVECRESITRAYACIISDKRASTLIPIILSQVHLNSTIWTDEHRSYVRLREYFQETGTVCHKFNFITEEGINTQSVESFNNCIKMEIKKRKGVLTIKREVFLKEFCFKFNNRGKLLEAVIEVIKV